jgi:putative oxidoreductase
MKKYLHIALAIIFGLILLMPVGGLVAIFLGMDANPKPEYYNTQEAYAFIMMLMETQYIVVLNALTCLSGIILLFLRRIPLAAVIVFPVSVNVVAFHGVLDGGLFTSGAFLGNVMFMINVYFFWVYRALYARLFERV